MKFDIQKLPKVAQTLDHTCAAACFDSMYQLVFGSSPGEMHFAEQLGTLDTGYTPVERITPLVNLYGLHGELIEGCSLSVLSAAVWRGEIVFVTWWLDDAGHYSLVRSIEDHQITLMDPWQARDGLDTLMSLEEFLPLWTQRGAKMIGVRP